VIQIEIAEEILSHLKRRGLPTILRETKRRGLEAV